MAYLHPGILIHIGIDPYIEAMAGYLGDVFAAGVDD